MMTTMIDTNDDDDDDLHSCPSPLDNGAAAAVLVYRPLHGGVGVCVRDCAFGIVRSGIVRSGIVRSGYWHWCRGRYVSAVSAR